MNSTAYATSTHIAFSPFLIIITGIIILLIIFAIKKRKLALLLIPIILGVIIIVSGIFLSPKSQIHAYNVINTTEVYPDPVKTSDSLPIWTEGLDEYFQADIYPSINSAANALARNTASTIKTAISGSRPVIFIYAEPTVTGLAQDTINNFCKGLKLCLPQVQIKISSNAPVDLKTKDNISIWLKQPQFNSSKNTGSISAKIISNKLNIPNKSVSFTNKNWVDNFAGFINQPGTINRNFLIARSYETCTSQTQAHDQAIKDACTRIQKSIKNIHGNIRKTIGVNFKITPNDLYKQQIIKDKFTQSFKSTVGHVWREALLLDASPDKIMFIRQSKISQSKAQYQSWTKMLGSAAAMALVIFILYIFLNAATKGYYSMALKIVAFIVLIIIIGAVLLTA